MSTLQPIEQEHVSSKEAHSQLPLVALVLAGISIVLGCTVIWGFLALPLGIAAIVVGMMARSRAHAQGNGVPQMAVVALILGPIGVALSILVVVLLLVIGPFLHSTVSQSTSPIQSSIQSDIKQINRDEAQRLAQANLFQKYFEQDLNSFNDDLNKRMDQLSTIGGQTTKDLSSLRDTTNAALNALQSDLLSLHATTDNLSTSISGVQNTLQDLVRKMNYLCGKDGSCP
jgi:predicted PurR-regulated permease PerM